MYDWYAPRISIGTKSLVMIDPKDIIPPAPSPHNARAAMKLVMLWARAHHIVESRKIDRVNIMGGFLPIVSESRPKSGWKLVEVKRKAVDNQDALFDE
jgi:hypothetical protein